MSFNILKIDDIKLNKKLIGLLEKIKPVSFIIFGSYANNKATKSSDIDFMIFFKKNQIYKNNFKKMIENFKIQLINIFQKNIDLIVMEITNKLKYDEHDDNYNNCTNNFISNIIIEGINIYGNNFLNIIKESIIYLKI